MGTLYFLEGQQFFDKRNAIRTIKNHPTLTIRKDKKPRWWVGRGWKQTYTIVRKERTKKGWFRESLRHREARLKGLKKYKPPQTIARKKKYYVLTGASLSSDRVFKAKSKKALMRKFTPFIIKSIKSGRYQLRDYKYYKRKLKGF